MSEQQPNVVISKEECAHILLGVAKKAASRCCELANPAQMRQIASQTEDLLHQQRFVAGRGRCGGEPSGRCCWPGRSGGAAGRECHGEEDGGTAAESHREDVAGRGRCGRDGAKRKSERKSLPLRRRRCNATDAQKPLRRRRCNATDAQKPLQCSRCTEADPLGARKKRRASTDRWHRKSNPAQRLVTPMPAAQEK